MCCFIRLKCWNIADTNTKYLDVYGVLIAWLFPQFVFTHPPDAHGLSLLSPPPDCPTHLHTNSHSPHQLLITWYMYICSLHSAPCQIVLAALLPNFIVAFKPLEPVPVCPPVVLFPGSLNYANKSLKSSYLPRLSALLPFPCWHCFWQVQ